MTVSKETRDLLLLLSKEKGIYLEGNILKIIRAEDGDSEFSEYLKESSERDISIRKKRLEMTKQVQRQNSELEESYKKTEMLMRDLEAALAESRAAEQSATLARAEAERLRDEAFESLDDLQKRTQFELMGHIVKVALGVIIGVGTLTTLLYVYVLHVGMDSKIIESTWSNLFGILLTNSFSIIGTIMGVKYANEKS
jgi:multidrug efflux pump subunit AcrA (membrane-fusion protein)